MPTWYMDSSETMAMILRVAPRSRDWYSLTCGVWAVGQGNLLQLQGSRDPGLEGCGM